MNAMPTFDAGSLRVIAAIAVVATYVLLCIWIYLAERAKRRRAGRDDAAFAAGGLGTEPVLVAFASHTGNASQLARQSAKLLHNAGVAAHVMELGHVGLEKLAQARQALFIVSTYGEGDAPDNAARFVEQVMSGSGPALDSLRYAVLALGDGAYADFCGFGRRLDAWLQAQKAQPMFGRVDVDNDDAAALQAWFRQVGHQAGTADVPDWQAPPFEPWRLMVRRVLNPGSAGGPVCHLELEPAGGPLSHWQAGDLAQVSVPADPKRPREYTVSSLPSDGRLHLLVRQERHPDGRLGLASGWLTAHAEIGGRIDLRIRPHESFRIGGNAGRPLVLVGNGTGIAGLRSHLKCRAASMPAPPAWLVFGERQARHDRLFADEIDDWLARGVLARADLVFSRDLPPERRYVQHRLREESTRLLEWVEGGAAIYVCGSLEGMAGGVDEALSQMFGADMLARLADEGRYRRDVY